MAQQRTPLFNLAKGKGAVFQESYGWELPRTYGDVSAEYEAGTQGVAIHDSSYAGRLKATGEDVLDLLDRISTNQVGSLQPGQGAATILTTDRGRILDLISVVNLGPYILLLTSPQTRDDVIQWIDKYTFVEDVLFEDVTADTAMLSMMGPSAMALVKGVLGFEPDSLQLHQSANITMTGVEGYVIKRDLVSTPRFEVVVRREDAERVWLECISAGAVPVGLEAYEVLRIEAGAPGYGKEMGEAYNPLETGLWGSISFTKGCYIGQEVIARLDTYQKVQKHLVYLSFSSGAKVEEGMKLEQGGKEMGTVTSVATVPTTGHLIGLGYVRKAAAEVSTQLSFGQAEGAWAKIEDIVLPFGPGEQV